MMPVSSLWVFVAYRFFVECRFIRHSPHSRRLGSGSLLPASWATYIARGVCGRQFAPRGIWQTFEKSISVPTPAGKPQRIEKLPKETLNNEMTNSKILMDLP
jgi:hypothetical protein